MIETNRMRVILDDPREDVPSTPDTAAMMHLLKADVQRRNEVQGILDAKAILDAASEYTWRRGPYTDVYNIADLIETAFRDGAVWAIDREKR